MKLHQPRLPIIIHNLGGGYVMLDVQRKTASLCSRL